MIETENQTNITLTCNVVSSTSCKRQEPNSHYLV
jgi:hypothetical protein